jgi:hypothetical protein
MRLDNILADIASNVKHARVERRRKSRLAKYRASPYLAYSRLYAFRRNAEGRVEIVPSEAAIVKLVFGLFADGLTAQEIKRELDAKDLRNRAGYRWTAAEITGLVRPVFAGLVPQRLGFRRSAIYEPIVDRQVFDEVRRKVGAKAAKSRVESAAVMAPGLLLGGRSWLESSIPVKGCGVRLSQAFMRTADRAATLAAEAR